MDRRVWVFPDLSRNLNDRPLSAVDSPVKEETPNLNLPLNSAGKPLSKVHPAGKLLRKLVEPMGVEPTTFALRRQSSICKSLF
jgi:hypothetical protein